MAIEFAERESGIPDTIPVDIVRAHRRTARRTVARSAQGATAARWEARIARLAILVAVVAGLMAAILMGMAIKPVRVPLLVLGILVAAVAAAAWLRRTRR